jgi:adenylate cyclase
MLNKRFILFVFAYWIIGTNLITLFLLGGVEMYFEMLQLDAHLLPEAVTGYMLSYHQYIEATLFSFLFALLFIFIHYLTEKKEYGRMGFGKIILLKSAIYVIGFTVIFFIIYAVVTNLTPQSKESIAYFTWSPATTLFIATYSLFLVTQIVFLNFIIQSDRTFGPSRLANFLSGKYHIPVIEDRVFLFIDLKDSTSYAEQLGSIKYSMLIKDCFADINTLIRPYKAEIYQYVGDEVVITWLTTQTIDPPLCVDIFFAFKDLLEERTDYYQNKYGLLPKFKAGVNGGTVTATEIGDIKRDIAYHGDVLNTASRIQEACNQYQQSFMITGGLLHKLKGLEKYDTKSIGSVMLKGKHAETEVYAIKKF